MKNVKEKSTEELINDIKKLQAVSIGLGIVLLILLSTFIYGILTKENKTTIYALLIIPFSVSLLLLLNASMINKMKKELKARNRM